MKRIYIVNGPNLNLLGKREPEIYGAQDFDSFFEQLKQKFPAVDLHYFQSNHEGELVDYLQAHGFNGDGIVLNAAAYTHTSVALSDAIAAIESPVVEVHISNIYAREEFRKTSLTASNAKGVITGLGLHGYEAAIGFLLAS